MAEDNVLRFIIDAENRAEAAMKEAEGQVKSLSERLQNMQPVFKQVAIASGAAFAAVTGAIYASVKAAEESNKVQAQLGSVLRSTSGIAGVSADMATKLASSLQEQTTYSDEAVLSAENLLLTFTNISKDAFPQATAAVLDMSTALGQDLQSSAIQLGKALQDPILGVTALRRVGVNFNEAQQEVIKNLVATGQAAKAQSLILKEITTEFGGSAKNAASTFSGELEKMKNRFDNVGEKIGNVFVPILKGLLKALEPILKWIEGFINAHPGWVAAIMAATAALTGMTLAVSLFALNGPKLIAFFVTTRTYLISWTASLNAAMGPLGWILTAVGLVATAIALDYSKKLDDAAEKDLAFGESMKLLADRLVKLREPIQKTSAEYQALGDKVKETTDKIKDLEKEITNSIKENADKQIEFNENKAQVFVDQETKIADLKKQIAEATSQDQILKLQTQLATEEAALRNNQQFTTDIQAEITEMRRRANLTEFENKLETLMRSRIADLQAYQQKLVQQLQELTDLKNQRAQMLIVEAEFTKGFADEEAKRLQAIKDTNEEIKRLMSERAGMIGAGLGQGGFYQSTTSGYTEGQLPHFASGGIVTGPTLAMVGEEGPEAIVPLGRGRSGFGNIILNINGGYYLSESVAEQLGDLIIRKLKRQIRI